MEEEVAAVEDDEVVHKGPDKKGRVLWVMSHIPPLIVRESVLSLVHQNLCRSLRHQNVRTNSVEPRPIVNFCPSTVLLFNPCR